MRSVLLAALLLAGCSRYERFTLPDPGTPQRISWQWSANPAPVLEPRDSWESSDVLNPSVLRLPDGRLANYYSGFDGKTWHTGLAINQQRHKLLSPDKTSWHGDDYIAANGSALLWKGKVHYWFQAGRKPQIGLATHDGGSSNMNVHPEPVLARGPRGSWDELAVADPYVIQEGGQLYLFYLGMDRAKRQRLGVARSLDGIHWTKLTTNPILELGAPGTFDEIGLGEPAVWKQHGSYWMLYTGRAKNEVRRMGLARSQDGVHWKRVEGFVIEGDQPWNKQVVCDPSVLLQGDEVRVWFGGGDVASPDERLHGRIGTATLRPLR